MADVERAPTRRAVLLGASNVTRALPTVVDTVRGFWNEPVDILAALGNGRSYGMRSWLLGRALPPILQCGLWEALETRPRLPTTALVTDIGNDILYHVPVERIASWVEQCFERLERAGARILMTGLPTCNVSRLSKRRFLFFRTLFVPMCRLSLAETVERSEQLNERLIRIAAEHGVTVIPQQEGWYGLDPIHIRAPHWRGAWRDILSPWLDDVAPPTSIETAMLGLKTRLLPPAERAFFGVTFRRAQPCARMRDGTTLSIY
jgi:hypothetical protein